MSVMNDFESFPKAINSIFLKLEEEEKEILFSFIKENLQVINKPNVFEDLQKFLNHGETKIQQQIETKNGVLIHAETKNPNFEVYKQNNNANKNLIPLTKIFNTTYIWLSFDEVTNDLTVWKSILNEKIHKHLDWEKLSETDLNFFKIFPFIFNKFEKEIDADSLIKNIDFLKKSLTKEAIRHSKYNICNKLKKDERARLLHLLVNIYAFISKNKQ